jgi:uncharacterized membrane protein (UPF0127 family)
MPSHSRAAPKPLPPLPVAGRISPKPARLSGDVVGAGRRSSDGPKSRFDRLPALTLPGGARVYVAADRRSRARGLSGLRQLEPDEALLLEPCRSIHTFGMRFALDVVWLDTTGRLVRLDENVVPRRLRTCRRARAVIETAAGHGERLAQQLLMARGSAAAQHAPPPGSGPTVAGRT